MIKAIQQINQMFSSSSSTQFLKQAPPELQGTSSKILSLNPNKIKVSKSPKMNDNLISLVSSLASSVPPSQLQLSTNPSNMKSMKQKASNIMLTR
mmetsp:Transcript_14627/g.14253  ORF Transcript_14627/g.14253 Transcript_14627/m.14253 type:complete len:95 (+) Transcript_14627:193-477(+)